jgi:hypothetical protein
VSLQDDSIGRRRRHKADAVAVCVTRHPNRGLGPYDSPLQRCTVEDLAASAMAQLGVGWPISQ